MKVKSLTQLDLKHKINLDKYTSFSVRTNVGWIEIKRESFEHQFTQSCTSQLGFEVDTQVFEPGYLLFTLSNSCGMTTFSFQNAETNQTFRVKLEKESRK